jgi:subtilisin-like proprotein convertase family protein
VGLTSEVAIANVVPKPGFTDFVIYVYDQNGLLDYVCEKLNERQVEYIDLQTWGYVNPGFKGSAVISAIFWEHDVFDDRGRFVRNLVGLGAVAIERNTTGFGMDVPGDEAAGSRGIPFAQGITEGDDFEFCPMGPAPLCPGVPLTRPDPNACPPEATFDCINCPQLIPTTGTAGPMNTALIDVDIPTTCEITDIDVTLDLNHTWIGDLDVDLTSPAGTASEMFNAICGNFDDLAAILDDDAAQPIGSVCSPLGFARYTTQSGFGLDIYDGESPTGTWMLDINDLVGGDAGQLNTWSVTIQTR